jgi:hypothetical protein
MELYKANITTAIYNFGQPRVGEALYAAFVNSAISNYWRFTHNKDMVPHLPPMDGFEYYHSCREVFENEVGELRICSAVNCEDTSCADQYSLLQTNTDDHLYYLGHRVDCDTSTIKIYLFVFCSINKIKTTIVSKIYTQCPMILVINSMS